MPLRLHFPESWHKGDDDSEHSEHWETSEHNGGRSRNLGVTLTMSPALFLTLTIAVPYPTCIPKPNTTNMAGRTPNRG